MIFKGVSSKFQVGVKDKPSSGVARNSQWGGGELARVWEQSPQLPEAEATPRKRIWRQSFQRLSIFAIFQLKNAFLCIFWPK